MSTLSTGFIQLLAPILPHLSVEFATHHPQLKDQISNSMQKLLGQPTIPFDLISDNDVEDVVKFTQKLRLSLCENSDNKIDFPKAVIFLKFMQ